MSTLFSPMELTEQMQKTLDDFHKLFYGPYWKEGMRQGTHEPLTLVRWLGAPVLKHPFDMMVYQEILWEKRPNLIIECGTCAGGSALFLASICEMMRHGEVITIDRDKLPRALHPGITYVVGDALDESILSQLREAVKIYKDVMVVLDDDHHRDHVLQEMEVYSKLVSKGHYMVVEDTNVNGHPVAQGFGPGPWEAVEEFLLSHPEFVQDRKREHFGITHNPGGWLLKV